MTDARDNIAEVTRLTGDRPFPVLVDLDGSSLTRHVRTYYASAEVSAKFRALALLVTNPVSRVLANFFIAVKHPDTPTRLFTSEGEALQWLHSYRQRPSAKPPT